LTSGVDKILVPIYHPLRSRDVAESRPADPDD